MPNDSHLPYSDLSSGQYSSMNGAHAKEDQNICSDELAEAKCVYQSQFAQCASPIKAVGSILRVLVYIVYSYSG